MQHTRGRLEIVVDREPDGGTFLAFFRDGEEVEADALGFDIYVVDPRDRSDGEAEWQEAMESDAADASAAAADLLRTLARLYAG